MTSLKSLENKHKGKLGFVIGAGPSLHFQDVTPLEDYVTITANSGILKIPDCDYFVSDDQGVRVWNYYRDIARDSRCAKILFKNKLSDAVDHFRREEVYLFGHKTWYSPSEKKYYPDGLVMTKDADAPIIGARTSQASAVHWAYIMGCDPIVLLGCDCCYDSYSKRYFWQFPGETKGFQYNGRPVFAKADKGRKNGKPVDTHCIEFIEYWKQFAKTNKSRANIIYASEGGVLDCFPKMTLKEVLERYGDRRKKDSCDNSSAR